MKTNLLKKLILSLLLMAVCIGSANAQVEGVLEIGDDSFNDIITVDKSGTGWTWTASSATLCLTSDYNSGSIRINCTSDNAVINLKYTGNVTVTTTNASYDAIRILNGSLLIDATNDTDKLTLTDTGENYGLYVEGLLAVNSGNLEVENTGTGIAIGLYGDITVSGSASVKATSAATSALSLGKSATMTLSTGGDCSFISNAISGRRGSIETATEKDLTLNVGSMSGKLTISSGRYGIHMNSATLKIAGAMDVGGQVDITGDLIGINISGDLEINVTGPVNITTNSSGDAGAIEGSYGMVTVKNGTVTLNSGSQGVACGLPIAVEDGMVTINGQVGREYGFQAELTVSGGKVDVTGDMYRDLTVSGGEVTIGGTVIGTTTHTGGTLNGQSAPATITGTMSIGGTTNVNLASNNSGTGWTWTAATGTLSLTSTYTGEAIAINCQNTDEIKLVYTGDISISSADADAIYCNGSLTINGSGGTLSFAYTGEDYMYSAITSMWPLTINSGNINASCTAVGNLNNNAAAVYAMRGFIIAGNANITTNVTSAYSHGFFTNLFNSEISTTGTVTADATGEGYAICIGNEYNLTISNGTVNLSNTDTPANMIYNRFQNGNFNMTGGTVIYNNETPPTLTSINPTSGTHNINVALSGSNLTGVTNVSVNGKTTKSFTENSDNQVTFTTPSADAGTASVLIETLGGATYLTNSFTYTNTSYRVTITSGGNYIGAVLGFIDTEANTTIAKPADPEPIKEGSTTFVSTGGWYKNRTCTTEWDFDTDVVDRDMNIYAKFEYLPVMTPADGATGVALNATVSATYFGVTGIDLSGITILPDPGNVSASIEGSLLTIAHNNFAPNTEYTVTIPANATSVNTVEVSWKFTTGAVPILSSDASLSSLTVSAGTLSPAFSASVTEYTVTIANSISSITINATANHAGAIVSGDTGLQNLTIGKNEFTILVTAEDGITTKPYKVTITRQSPPLSTDATLSSLTVSEGTLTPAFSATITNYTVEVEYSVEEIAITAMANDGNATVTGDTGEQSLTVGSNSFTITVTAEDGSVKTYTVIVTRKTNPVGIEDVYAETGIQIYPNPITDYFHVKGITESTIVSIYTVYGKIVLQPKVQAEKRISVGHLPSGIYLINVDGKTFKVVKK